MGWWLLGTDTLAESRFVVSPLAETTACLIELARGAATRPGERRRLDVHRPAYLARLAADPVTALLVRSALRPRYLADFATPAPTGEPGLSFGEELARIRGQSAGQVHEDLRVALGGPVPARLHRPDLAGLFADLLEWLWTVAVRPDWDRRRRILEADVAARTGQLGRGGWVTALDAMRPGMRWLGDGRLQVNPYDYPPRDLAGTRLLFVPVTPDVGWVCWADGRNAVVYPCAGVLANPDPAPVPEALGRLLGPSRARVLVMLGTPTTTSRLVDLTGQGLGSVGRHLRVLREAGLIRGHRTGRTVRYARTPAGDLLVAAQRR